ncbi:MAG: hypothetical protein FWD24_01065 [Treponema sp.]|nr:hypothetical protein [Treponema sp.]
MENIINALLESIRALGIDAVLMPQKTSANRPRMELYFSKLEPAGIDRNNPELVNKGWERITFNAEFKSEGTHSRWVTDTIIALRKLLPLHESNMRLTAAADKKYHFNAHWIRRQNGRFEYPDEEQSSMPVRYAQGWEISISYPANIIKEKI